MSDIDIFEEAIDMLFFGIEPGSNFHDCFYDNLKEKEKLYLIGSNKEDFEAFEEAKVKADTEHKNIHLSRKINTDQAMKRLERNEQYQNMHSLKDRED